VYAEATHDCGVCLGGFAYVFGMLFEIGVGIRLGCFWEDFGMILECIWYVFGMILVR